MILHFELVFLNRLKASILDLETWFLETWFLETWFLETWFLEVFKDILNLPKYK